MAKTLNNAEARENHNGEIEIAKEMVREAKKCGADIVKFQTAKLSSLVSKTAKMAEYQKENIGQEMSQREMLKKLLLSYDEFTELAAYCREIGITFLSTPFDLESIDFLEELGCDMWKIPSGEITNLPYLEKIGKTHKNIILSTGMCTMQEVEDAVNVLDKNDCGKITLLHCTTQYPTAYCDVNLKAMLTLHKKFGYDVGYSDHTQGIEVPIAAIAMGATVIEKHFTLDRNMEGPDHKASLEPHELRAMVCAIHNIEQAMGDGVKRPSASERRNIGIVRKSIVAKRDISEGEILSEENITTKRPGTGISPMMWEKVIGQSARKNYKADEMIEL